MRSNYLLQLSFEVSSEETESEEEVREVEHFHLMQTEELTKYDEKKILKKRTKFSELKEKARQPFKHLQCKHNEDKKLNDNLEERNLQLQHLSREHKTQVEELTTLTSVLKKCQDENVQLKQKMNALLEWNAEVQTSSLKYEIQVEELRAALQQTENILFILLLLLILFFLCFVLILRK